MENTTADDAVAALERMTGGPVSPRPRPPLVVPDYGRPARAATNAVVPQHGPDDIVCVNPNCGYHGVAVKRARANLWLFLLLFLLWMIPGIVYAVLYSGYELTCPRCGVKARDQRGLF